MRKRPGHVHRLAPTPAASCTACGRSSTTPSTRRSAGHGTRIEIVAALRRQRRGARPRARHPRRHRAQAPACRASRWSSPKLHAGGKFGAGLVLRRRADLHGVGASRRQRAVGAPRRRGRPRRQDLGDVVPPRRAGHLLRCRRRPTRRSRRSRTRSELRVVGKAAEGRRPARASATGPTGRSSPRTPRSDLHGARAARAADGVPRARASRSSSATSAERSRSRPSYRFDGGISEFADFLAPDARGHRHLAPDRGTGASPRPSRCSQPTGAMVPTEVERECEVDVARPLGHRATRPSSRSFVNIIATPKGGTHQAGLRAGPHEGPAAIRWSRTRGGSKVGNDKLEKDDILAGLTAVLTVRLPEAAVRGSDEGGARHAGRAPRSSRTSSVREGLAARFSSSEARRQGADGAAARQGRRRDEGAHLGARAQGDAAAQERAGVVVAPGKARRLPLERRARAPSCSSSRATRPSAPPSSPATASTRRSCRSAARSSTCRRPRSATCSRTPSAPRSSR